MCQRVVDDYADCVLVENVHRRQMRIVDWIVDVWHENIVFRLQSLRH